MKILFIGCVISSEFFLETLINNHYNIVGVVTKKEGGFNSDFKDLSVQCNKNNIDSIYTNDVNDMETLKFIHSKQPDVIYCFGWSQLIKKEIINIPKYGVFGFHPTKLPNNKGRHPIIWTLALGLKTTASTFFKINELADAGQIISQKEIEVLYEDDANTLYQKIIKTAAQQLIIFTEHLENNTLKPIPIENTKGNIWRKRTEQDGQIDFRMSSYGIYNLIRSLTHPYIGSHFIYQNKHYKVWKSKELFLSGLENIEPGKVLEVKSNQHIVVKTFDNAIELIECDKIDVKKGDYLI